MSDSIAQQDIAAALEEEQREEQKTLPGIIRKMKSIGKEHYHGKIYDNIYSIFNQLTVNERRMLLKGIINILLIIEDKAENGSLVTSGWATGPALGQVQSAVQQVEDNLNGTLSNIEQFNKMEMIKLKTYMTKMAMAAVLIGAIGMMLVSVYLSKSKTETVGMFSDFTKILMEMLGM